MFFWDSKKYLGLIGKLVYLQRILGDVAQLARALRWQRRGRGFEPHLLHKKTETFLFRFFYFMLIPIYFLRSFWYSSATFSSSAYQLSPKRRIKASLTNLYTGTCSSLPSEQAGSQISQRS